MGTATILVVDDERKIRDLVRSYLEREGYSVLVADTGQRALEAASKSSPDLVVLDLMLPDLSGEEVARSLRSASEVPIIMLTAKAGEDDRVGAFDSAPTTISSRRSALASSWRGWRPCSEGRTAHEATGSSRSRAGTWSSIGTPGRSPWTGRPRI